MGAYNFLLYSTINGTATVSLNRPEVYNALNDEITFELQDALKAVAKDDTTRVLVLTGEGKAFCAGQDLKASPKDSKRSFVDSLRNRYNPIIRALRALPKPVICRLNGVAAGAGCSLALACDLIVASQEATLIEVFVNIGLVPDSGSSFFLPRAVGMAKAFELCTMGSRLTADEALSMGLINKAVPAHELDGEVRKYTDYFSTAPAKAIGLIKKMLQKSAHATLEEMLEYEAWCQEIAGSTEDYREGVAAFLGRRPAKFSGK